MFHMSQAYLFQSTVLAILSVTLVLLIVRMLRNKLSKQVRRYISLGLICILLLLCFSPKFCVGVIFEKVCNRFENGSDIYCITNFSDRDSGKDKKEQYEVSVRMKSEIVKLLKQQSYEVELAAMGISTNEKISFVTDNEIYLEVVGTNLIFVRYGIFKYQCFANDSSLADKIMKIITE